MSSLPPSSKYLQQADADVDETEREALTQRLSDAFAEGRIDQDQYMAGLDVIYGATTLGQLVPVVETLPSTSVDVPDIVKSSGSPSGHVSASRNVLLPALLVTGVGLALLVTLLVVAFLLVAL